MASTIREILRNAAYIGERTFKKRQWMKLPGTNTRRYRRRDEAEVIRQMHPELAIIDAELWAQVRARAESVRATYTKPPSGAARGAVSGRRNNYVLSGLLVCGECGAAMTIASGTSASYYSCSDYKKRGTCANRRSIREDVARVRIFSAIAKRYDTPEAVDFLRKALTSGYAELGRAENAELLERRARLARTEERIRNLIEFISRGETFTSIGDALADLEAQSKQERQSIARLEEMARKPIRLPTSDAGSRPADLGPVRADPRPRSGPRPRAAPAALRRRTPGQALPRRSLHCRRPVRPDRHLPPRPLDGGGQNAEGPEGPSGSLA